MDEKIYDYIVIGSGFGGSVSALRLVQKGYDVLVIESGKNYSSSDFAKSNWKLNKFLWMPKLFLYGIQRINIFRHVMVLSGSGVGGGSLVYGATLYKPVDAFYENEIIKKIGSKVYLDQFFETASHMLGVTKNPKLNNVDKLLLETSHEFGASNTFTPTSVGIYFGDPGVEVDDPYFKGQGPKRSGCTFCGGCITGCRNNSKNTLDKNYLFFAQKHGATILPEYKVIDIIPYYKNNNDTPIYEIVCKQTTSFLFPKIKKFKTKNIVISAGVIGTNSLLFKMKSRGRLPDISNCLGKFVRTNSEAIIGVTAKKNDSDYSLGVAISSSVYIDKNTHIEPVRYSRGNNAMGLITTLLTDGGGSVPRFFKYILNCVKHPIDFFRTLIPINFAQKSIILLVMQPLDNCINLTFKKSLFSPFKRKLNTQITSPDQKIPNYIPIAHKYARSLAKRMNGVAQGGFNDVIMDIPTTAHFLGGCVMGDSSTEGVIDLQNRLYGYKNILVCDGSMIPANLGVNPSLTITAFTERAVSFIKHKNFELHKN